MENKHLVAEESILSKIYLIRDQKVLIDKDLAEIYGIETKRLKEAVRRNLERFPEDFMFELTDNEMVALRSQIATSKEGRGGDRYNPMVFTEHGVLMLSSVLNSKKAIQVNIQIMRIFTRVRKMLTDNTELRLAIEELRHETSDNTRDIDRLFQHLDKFIEKNLEEKPMTKIGYQFMR